MTQTLTIQHCSSAAVVPDARSASVPARRSGLLLAAAVLGSLPALAGCADGPARAGLPAAPRAGPPPILEDTPRNPAAAGGQRADAGGAATVPG